MKKIILTLFILLFGTSAFSQSELKVRVDKNPVISGEQFQVTFSIEGDGRGFRGPNFKGFSVLSGPFTSRSTQYINGAFSQSLSYIYTLQVGEPGEYTILSASIEAEGKRISSKPIKINVVKGTSNQRDTQQSNPDKDIDAQAKEVIGQNLFIRSIASKTNVYQGEQFLVTHKLYVHPDLQLVGMEQGKHPTYNGFWKHDLVVGQQKWEQDIYDGVRYRTIVLEKVLLSAQQSGTIKIERLEKEFVARLQVQGQKRRSRDPFESFFGRNNYKDFKYTARSRPLSINVKPLPDNAPASFNGSVGSMKLEAWLDKNETVQNDPITLKIKLSGNTNLKLLNAPNIEFPPGIESYDPKTIDNVSIRESGISGNMVFEYLLIPRNEGTYKINPIEITYFDLQSKQYKTLTSDEFIIKVGKGEGGDATTIVSGTNKEKIQYLGKDIRFIMKSSDGLSKNGSRFFPSIWFWIMLALPIAVFGFTYSLRRKYHKLNANVILVKNRKATKIARKRLANAKKNINDTNVFYEELTKALWMYLSDKLSVPISELTKDSAKFALTNVNVNEDLIDKYMKVLDHCEFARFSPSENHGVAESDYKEASEVIEKMEGALK